MLEGFNETTADGEEVIVVLDMVGCVGDAPALNSAFDVMGHNSNACCHL